VNVQELHRVLVRVVPPMPSPQDRVGSVIQRARRQRQATIVAAAAVLTGIVALGTVPFFRAALADPPPIGPGTGGGTTGSPTTSPTGRTDGVLETPGCTGYNPPTATMVDGTPVAPNQEALSELAMRIQPYAMSHFGDVFATVEFRPDGRLRLNRKPSRALDAWVMREFAAECVEIADAKATSSEMEAWARRIDIRYWERRGIRIYTMGGDPVDGILVIEVAEPDLARAREEIPKKYPDLPIRVEKGAPVVPLGG
jgi:hypothetical protein